MVLRMTPGSALRTQNRCSNLGMPAVGLRQHQKPALRRPLSR
jgi:hypothetical protein